MTMYVAVSHSNRVKEVFLRTIYQCTRNTKHSKCLQGIFGLDF